MARAKPSTSDDSVREVTAVLTLRRNKGVIEWADTQRGLLGCWKHSLPH